MAKIRKFVEQIDWLWYECDITDEQAQEYRDYETALEINGNAEIPDWVDELDWDLTRSKAGSDDVDYTIADNGEYLVGEEAIKYEENEFGKKDE